MRFRIPTSFWTLITMLSLGTILVILILLTAQNNKLGKQLQSQTQAIQTQTGIIQEQTAITQRYLRCLLLIPSEEFLDKDARVLAIDKCVKDSVLPDAGPGTVPPSSSTTPSSRVVPAETATQQPMALAPPSSEPSSPTPAPEEQGAVEQLLQPVVDLIKDLL